jgi:hypothetical protein
VVARVMENDLGHTGSSLLHQMQWGRHDKEGLHGEVGPYRHQRDIRGSRRHPSSRRWTTLVEAPHSRKNNPVHADAMLTGIEVKRRRRLIARHRWLVSSSKTLPRRRINVRRSCVRMESVQDAVARVLTGGIQLEVWCSAVVVLRGKGDWRKGNR